MLADVLPDRSGAVCGAPPRRAIERRLEQRSAWPQRRTDSTVRSSPRSPRVRRRLQIRQHAVAHVDVRRLLRDEVQAVQRRRSRAARRTACRPRSDWWKSSAIRSSQRAGERASTAAAAASIRRRSSMYSGNLLPGRVEQGEHADASAQLGTALEQERERLQAARTTFFDGSVRSTRRIIVSGRDRGSSRSCSSTAGSRRVCELVRVDRDRMRRHERLAHVEAQCIRTPIETPPASDPCGS